MYTAEISLLNETERNKDSNVGSERERKIL
jgi:hypothetical protein